MIGRVVFCWFLKKKAVVGGKPLIPEEVLSLQAVQDNKNYQSLTQVFQSGI